MTDVECKLHRGWADHASLYYSDQSITHTSKKVMKTLDGSGIALALIHILILMLSIPSFATDSPEVTGSGQHEELWQSTLDNSAWDILGPGDYAHLFTNEKRTSDIDTSDEKDGTDHSESMPSSSKSDRLQTLSTQGQRERKGQCFITRELSFARGKLNKRKMTLEEWREMVHSGDSMALQIKSDFDYKCHCASKYAQLVRKLKWTPDDPHLLEQLEKYNRTERDFRRQRSIIEKRLPMSKYQRNRFDSVMRRLRLDIQDINAKKKFRAIRSSIPEKERQKRLQSTKEGRDDPKYEAGDATAEPIIEKMLELRVLLRQAPLDESVWGQHWREINEWIQENQVDPVPFAKPGASTEVISPSDDGGADHASNLDSSGSATVSGMQDDAEEWVDYLDDDPQDILDHVI